MYDDNDTHSHIRLYTYTDIFSYMRYLGTKGYTSIDIDVHTKTTKQQSIQTNKQTNKQTNIETKTNLSKYDLKLYKQANSPFFTPLYHFRLPDLRQKHPVETRVAKQIQDGRQKYEIKIKSIVS